MKDERKFLEDVFERGLDFRQFVEEAGTKGKTFVRNRDDAAISEEVRKAFAELCAEHGGLRVLAMLEAWCPDAADNVPIIDKLADSVKGMTLRLFFRDERPELNQFFIEHGVERIPAVAVCTSDFQLLGTWQERPAPAHRIVDEIKKGRKAGTATRNLSKQLRAGYTSGTFRRATLEEILEEAKGRPG